MLLEISISEALALMNNEGWDWDIDQPKTYGLKYYGKDGGIRIRYNCRKNVKNIHQLKQKSTHSERGKYDRAIKGLVQIYDEDTNDHRSIQAAQIVYFRNHGTDKWIRIKN